MDCPKCKSANPSEAKFCEKCGAKLGVGQKTEQPEKEQKEAKIEPKEKQVKPRRLKIPSFSLPSLPIKNTFIFAGVGLVLLIIAGVFGFRALTNKPEIAVKKFFKAMGKRDFTAALALVVPEERLEAKSSLDSLFDNVSRLEIKKVKTKNVVVYDDEASVDVEMDFEIKLKSGERYVFLASKETLTVYDDKTKVEVPLSESSQYSIPSFSDTMNLEKVKGKWYITYR